MRRAAGWSMQRAMDTRETPDLMTVSEVADYLRVRERTIYELVRTQRIPSCKLSGKLLFPKRLIELWVAQSADYPGAATHLAAPPPVIAGSHDPLLEWAARESRCGLAILVSGSTAGMHRLQEGQAVACALHIIDPATGQYDAGILGKSLPGLDFVVVEWARRQQGLIVAPGNPAKIASVADLRKRGVRVAMRQEGSGSALLFNKLVGDAGLKVEDLKAAGEPVSSESDIAVAVREGKADTGLAIEAVAREQGLDFVPLQWERFDLVVRRVEYFEPPLQRLLAFARTEPFRSRAALLGGYDVTHTGAIVFNARR
jgi:putative molybdopterin biosynthesis protein